MGSKQARWFGIGVAAAVIAFEAAGTQTASSHALTTGPRSGVHGPAAGPARDDVSRAGPLRVNLEGRVPILEYHLIGDSDSRWSRSWRHFRQDLEMLYERGYRPVTVAQLVDRKFAIPPGTSPVVISFDDASPGQFRYVERGDSLEIDSTSAVGVWLSFHATHPEWQNRATFCLLPAADAGHAFFGDKGIQGQRTAWRFKKVRFLAEQGFELCDHTLWHADLAKYDDQTVQEQIARGQMAIDSAVPGYRVRTFALPLGVWPRNRALARRGAWTDPKTGVVHRYDFDAILEVSGGANRSPYDPQFNPLSLHRVQVNQGDLVRLLDMLDRTKSRYVAGGTPAAGVAHR